MEPKDRWNAVKKADLHPSYRRYLLPGMPIETAPLVRLLLRTPARELSFEKLWEYLKEMEFKEMEFYPDKETLYRVVGQLRTMRYVQVRTAESDRMFVCSLRSFLKLVV